MRGRLRIFLAAAALAGCSNDIGNDAAPAPLAPPTGLQGTPSPDGTSVTLSWTDNATGESAYRIDFGTIPILATPDVQDVRYAGANATAAVVPATPGDSFYCRVLAITATHQSKPSNMIGLTLPVIPIAVHSLSAVAASSTRVDLAWSDVPDETGYRLERADTPDTWSPIATLDADTTAATDIGLVPGTEYCYRLVSLGTSGESAPGNVACAATPGGGMTITTAFPDGDVGTYTSIGADAGGWVHVSHYDATFTDLLHTSGSGGSFTTATADIGPTAGSQVGLDGTSLALDGLGFVHIAAFEAIDRDLRYVTDESGSFVAVTLDAAGDVGSKAHLRVSPLDGSIHIVYRADGSLKRAVRTGGGWTFEVFTPAEYPSQTAFAIDATGTCHVAYVRWVDSGGRQVPELVYAENGAGPWTHAVVPTAGKPDFVSVAADGASVPHIVYYETTTQGLYYATLQSGSWTGEVIDQAAGVSTGRYNAVVLDPGGHPGRLHVAYQDYTHRDLRYARKDPGGPWVRRLVDGTGFVGSHAAIAVDPAGTVHISYHDEETRDLKMASGIP